MTAHVCAGEDVRTGDTFVTCGGEQPDVTTRASHDAYNNNKKKKITGGRLKECKHARGDTCPKHTHIHTQMVYFLVSDAPRLSCCSRPVLPQFSLRSHCNHDVHDDAHDSTDNGIPQREVFPGDCELL